MKRLGILILVAVITFAIVFFIQRPEVLEQVWLWLIGLAGVIVEGFRRITRIGGGGKEEKTGITPEAPVHRTPNPEINDLIEDRFDGVTMTVLRYSDDGTTTVGLLYVNGHYYCYTLEDTHQDEKVKGKTRIPAGKYNVDFLRHETGLTLDYRDRFDWFDFHLEIQNVPNFTGIYIHSGGDHRHTKGCLLVSDSLNMSAESTFLTNSRNTFERLYTYLKGELNKGRKVRLVIRDEKWFAKLNA